MPKNTLISAAFVGDSHGVVVIQAARARNFSFRRVIRATAPVYVNARLHEQGDGSVRFETKHNRINEDFANSEKYTKSKREENLSVYFNRAIKENLDFYSTVGMATFRFVRYINAISSNDDGNTAPITRKILKMAAYEHFDQYVGFYQDLISRAPRVTCIFGPTRYTPENRDIWMAYEDAAQDRLQEIGVEVLDLRARFGDGDLLLSNRYIKDDDDTVHANLTWGAEVFEEIKKHHSMK